MLGFIIKNIYLYLLNIFVSQICCILAKLALPIMNRKMSLRNMYLKTSFGFNKPSLSHVGSWNKIIKSKNILETLPCSTVFIVHYVLLFLFVLAIILFGLAVPLSNKRTSLHRTELQSCNVVRDNLSKV